MKIQFNFFCIQVREGDVVIDVGANLGSYTIPLAEKVGVTGGVFAFEPFRRMTQLLNANVALNGLSNVWVVQCALSDQSWVSIQAKQPQFNFFSYSVRLLTFKSS